MWRRARWRRSRRSWPGWRARERLPRAVFGGPVLGRKLWVAVGQVAVPWREDLDDPDDWVLFVEHPVPLEALLVIRVFAPLRSQDRAAQLRVIGRTGGAAGRVPARGTVHDLDVLVVAAVAAWPD